MVIFAFCITWNKKRKWHGYLFFCFNLPKQCTLKKKKAQISINTGKGLQIWKFPKSSALDSFYSVGKYKRRVFYSSSHTYMMGISAITIQVKLEIKTLGGLLTKENQTITLHEYSCYILFYHYFDRSINSI